MPEPVYSIELLKQLQHSPLAKRPDALPDISQWFEKDGQSKPRTASAYRNDENDLPNKRPSLFETRQTRFSSGGDDVYLGPKLSFASASAARQPKGPPTSETEDNGQRQSRFPGRGFRDRETKDQDSDRRRNTAFDQDKPGSRSHPKGRHNADEEDDRLARFKPRQQNGKEEEVEGGRRNGLGRGKFDQPWFRNNTKESGEQDSRNGERSWRDKEPRSDREWTRGAKVDEDPGWLLPSNNEEQRSHTVQDFENFKKQMKAADGKNSVDEKSPPSAAPLEVAPDPPRDQVSKVLPSLENATPSAVFGTWGMLDTDNAENSTPVKAPVTAAAPKKAKPSRFAGFFTPAEQAEQQRQQEQQQESLSRPETRPPPEPQQTPKSPQQARPREDRPDSSDEDQKGFARMMALLRTSGSGSQGPAAQLFSAPPPENLTPLHSNRSSRGPPPRPDEQPTSPSVHGIGLGRPMANPTPPASIAPRPSAVSRDSEFLLNLMKQPTQSRTPFSEGQIYGQDYSRRNQGEEVHSQFAPPPQPRLRGPPPGFFNNEPAFSANGGMDPRLIQDMPSRMKAPEERFQMSPHRTNSEDLLRHASKDHQRGPMSPFDQPPPPPQHMFNGGRPSSPQRMPPNVGPPPGFPGFPPAQSRGPVPPGFFQFPPQQANQMSGRPPGPPGPQGPPQQPHTFFNPPPGFGPPPGQGPASVGRRPPSGSMPPGFDVFAAGPQGLGPDGRRTMPQQQQQQHTQESYAQYMKQMRAGAYQGM